MTPSLKRDLAVTALFAGALVAGVTMSVGWQFVMLALAMLVLGFAWTWPRVAHHRLKSRLATPITVGFAGVAIAMFVLVAIGLVVTVLVIASVAVIAAAVDRARLVGAAIPGDGEGRGRCVFAGTAHAVGPPASIPALDRTAVAWVARQGRRRWSSVDRFELRDEQRRVLVEPGAAVIRGTALVIQRGLAQKAARALDGADPKEPIRVWSIDEGETVFVVGEPRLEADPNAPTLRDPGRVHVFVGNAVIGHGDRHGALAAAVRRLVLAGAVAVSAGGIAVATALRSM